MTVQTNTNVANFLGNGAATYPIGFKFNSAADLVVQKTVIATGVTTTLTLNSDYSVAGAGVEEGGSITFSQAPTSAESIKVTRVVDLLQLTDLRNQGKFYAEVHEAVFDKLVMIAQQQQTELKRAIKVPSSDPFPAPLPPVPQRAGMLLSFNDEGNPIAVAPQSGSAADLALILANSSDPDKGASRIGYRNTNVLQALDDLRAETEALASRSEGGSLATPLLSKEQTTICIIGDSLSTGQGATSPDFGWTNRFAESIYETFDGDVNSSVRSLGYPVLSNMREALSMPGITGNGTIITGYGTPSNELYRLLHNNYIEVTGRQAEYYDLFYDREVNGSDMSAGNIEISVNGVLKATKAVTTGTGVGTTYATGLVNPLGPLGAKIRPTDIVRFTFKSTTALAGDRIYVVGLSTVRQNSNSGPHVVKFNYPGWTFGNFLPLMTKIKSMVYAVRHSGTTPELYILALGSNSIYNASVAQTPAQYVSSLTAMATAIGLSATRKMAVWIPPKANASTKLAPYEDYVTAIREYCETNGVTCIDLSNSAVSSAYGSLLTDTMHWNNAGHGVVASDVLASLGLPYMPRNQAKPVPAPNLYSAITLTSPWGNQGGLAANAPIAKIKNNIVYLSGVIQPNGAANGAIGSLPGGYQPGTRALYAPVLSSSGMVSMTVSAGGAMTLSTFNATWYSLDGISFPLPSDVQ